MAKADPKGCVLTILMRNDLASMNAGKAVAHGGHAANAFDHAYDTLTPAKKRAWMPRVKAWRRSTRQGFGVTVSRMGSIEEIRLAVKEAKAAGLLAEIVVDPGYPLKDGKVVHEIRLQTCAFVFGPRAMLAGAPAVKAMPWMD